jgi:hypothetical protein
MGSLALIAVAVALAAPVASAADVQRYIVPPGTHTVGITCSGVAPLEDLRFVLGGPAELVIIQIRGNVGTPELNFPDVSPHQVTAYFAQNAIVSESVSFDILLHNPLDRPAHLTVLCL